MGGKTGIELSKKKIFQWYVLFKNKVNFPWSEELNAKRLINILYNYEFINSLSSKHEADYLNKIVYIHIKRLFFEFKKKSEFDLTSDELKAVTLFSLIFNKNNLKFLKKTEAALDAQVDALGMHKGYNPLEQMEYFLSKNKNFRIVKFNKIEKYAEINTFVDSNGYILIPPTKYKSFFIHRFFGVRFIKND